MTNDEINVAVAEAIGVKFHKPTEEEVKRGSYYQYEPSYTTCLNACHEMEKTLTKEEQSEFIRQLWKLEDRSKYRNDIQWSYWPMLHATARQRAEAFLRVKGLWKEDNTGG